MAGSAWTPSHPLAQHALVAARDFDLFALLHRIELALPAAPRIGHQGPAAREPLRLRPALSLGFPAGDVEQVEWSTEPDARLLLTTTFLGLYGPDSPLPAHFTEALLADQEEDRRVRGFLDLFHHRILSMLYRGWQKYRYHVSFQAGGADPISSIVRALLGIGTPHIDQALKLPPVKLFRYAGLFSQRPRSAAGLVGILRDHYDGIAFDLSACVGRWLAIEPRNQNLLGRQNCTLGADILVGERVYDQAGKFRVEIGPVGFDDYTRFLPTGDGIATLRELVGFYVGDPLAFDVQVTLLGAQVPDTPLGERGNLGRLGWTSWVKSKDCPNQAVVFQT